MAIYSTLNAVNESDEFNRLLEEVEPAENLNHLMEFVMQLDENDHQLFDSLIECDFISVSNGFVLNEAENDKIEAQSNEVKKTKIWDKIKAVLEKFKRFLVQAMQTIIAKIMDLFKADKKLYDAYKDVLTVENLKGFKGIANFAYPWSVNLTKKLNISEFDDAVNKFSQSIGKATDKADIDDAFRSFEDRSGKIISDINDIIDFAFDDKVDYFVPNKYQIQEMKNIMNNSSKIIEGIKKHTKAILDMVKNLETLAKATLNNKADSSEIEVYRATKLSSMTSVSVKSLSQVFSTFTNITMKQIAANRKAYIICGRAAAKNANGNTQVVHNSATEWIIGENSDAYVYECLAY